MANEQGTTIGDVGSTFAKATALRPGYYPRAMTGSLPASVVWTLLGSGLGRYAAAPIIERLYPELNKKKLRRAATVLGGLSGFLPGAYMMRHTWKASGGPQGLFGSPNDSPAPAEKAAAFGLPTRRPVSPMWTQPSIPAGISKHTLDTAVAEGTIGPYEAANVAQIMDEARPQGRGLMSPSSIARAAVDYGIGNVAGRALGAVANATFGSFSPGEQKNLARGLGLGNVVFNLMGRLASS